MLLGRHPQIGAVEVDEVNFPRYDPIVPKGIASTTLREVQLIDLLQPLAVLISHSYQLALPLTSEEVETAVATLIEEGRLQLKWSQISIFLGEAVIADYTASFDQVELVLFLKSDLVEVAIYPCYELLSFAI